MDPSRWSTRCCCWLDSLGFGKPTISNPTSVGIRAAIGLLRGERRMSVRLLCLALLWPLISATCGDVDDESCEVESLDVRLLQTKTQLLQPGGQNATPQPVAAVATAAPVAAAETPKEAAAVTTTQPLAPATTAPVATTQPPVATQTAPPAPETTAPVATTQPPPPPPVAPQTAPPAPETTAPVATTQPPPPPPVATQTAPPAPQQPAPQPAVQPAPVSPVMPPPRCRGDGRIDQNDACKYNPSWSGCVHSPGCNWNGQSYFGGWCEGGPRCVYLPSQAVCLGVGAACNWQQATTALNWTEGDVEAAHAAQAAAAAWSAAASASQAAVENSNCFGDGSFSQNMGCKYHILWGTCVLTAGCNWHGESALGGWCTGGTQCTYQPIGTSCMVTPGCHWQPATAPLMVPM
eukprot:symbB.v1.2.001604.t1/scaffold89.1/size472826/8